MTREEILTALDKCCQDRCAPDYNPPESGCPSCLLGDSKGITLICDELLHAVRDELTNQFFDKDRTFGISSDHINKVLDYYQFHGERMDICIEECSELIKALSKNLRSHQWPERVRTTKSESRQMIIEEVADVLVCCGMLQRMFNISQDEIDAVVQRKEERDNMTTPRNEECNGTSS